MGKRYSTAQSLFAFGPHQTDFQTMAANTTAPPNWRFIVKEGYDKASFDSPNVNNAGESTGLALPNKTYKSKDATKFSATEQLTFQLLGLRAADAFGVEASPTSLSGGAYLHKFSLLDVFVSPKLPSRPLASKVGEPAVDANAIYNALFPSMTYQTFGINTAGTKPSLSLASEFVGSGQFTEPSGIIFYGSGKHVLGSVSTEITETPINRGGGVVTIYPQINFAGTPIATACLIKDFALTINENITLNYDCILYQDGNLALGQIAGDAQSSGQTVTLGFTMTADSDVLAAFAANTRLKAGTEFSLINSFIGPIISGLNSHQADFRLGRAAIASVQWVDVEGGAQGLRIETEPLAVGNSLPLSLWLTTNVADFNAYVGA